MNKRAFVFLASLIAALLISLPVANSGPGDETPYPDEMDRHKRFEVAKKELRDGDYENAARLFKELSKEVSSEFTPSMMVELHLGLGSCYRIMGKWAEAEKELAAAFELSRFRTEQTTVLVALLRIYLAEDKPEDASRVIAALKQDDGYAWPELDPTAQLLKQRLASEISPSSADFYHSAFNSKLTVPAHSKIFNVFIDSQCGSDLTSVLKDSFEAWSSATQHAVRFIFVKQRIEADIVVLPNIGMESPLEYLEQGSAEIKQDECNQISRVKMTISVRNIFSKEEMKWVCLHQIGHALGIAKHSCNPDDVMYVCIPKGFETARLSARDSRTIKKAYSPTLQQQAALGLRRFGYWLLIIPAALLFGFARKAHGYFGDALESFVSFKKDLQKHYIDSHELFKCVGSFLLSLFAWTLLTGNNFPQAMAVMILLFLHEAGHYIAGRVLHARPELPIFLVFVAFVRMEQNDENPRDEFILAGAGPLLGAVAAGIFALFGIHTPWLLQAAGFGFALNLLQLIPVPPFDGGYMAKAIDRRLWYVGAVLLIVLVAVAVIRGELITAFGLAGILKVAVSSIRSEAGVEYGQDSSATEKLQFALAYLVLASILAALSWNSNAALLS